MNGHSTPGKELHCCGQQNGTTHECRGCHYRSAAEKLTHQTKHLGRAVGLHWHSHDVMDALLHLSVKPSLLQVPLPQPCTRACSLGIVLMLAEQSIELLESEARTWARMASSQRPFTIKLIGIRQRLQMRWLLITAWTQDRASNRSRGSSAWLNK